MPKLSNPPSLGKWPSDRKFKEVTEVGGGGGGEKEQNTAAHLVLRHHGTRRHAVLSAGGKVTRNLRPGTLISSVACMDTSDPMFSSSLITQLNT